MTSGRDFRRIRLSGVMLLHWIKRPCLVCFAIRTRSMFQALLISCLFLLPTRASKTINVNNNCPISLDIFFNLAFNGSVAPRGTATFIVDSDFGGQIYADANGGTFAGLFLPVSFFPVITFRFDDHFLTLLVGLLLYREESFILQHWRQYQPR